MPQKVKHAKIPSDQTFLGQNARTCTGGGEPILYSEAYPVLGDHGSLVWLDSNFMMLLLE